MAFAQRELGLTVWSRQRELLDAVRDHDLVAVRSGHKVSKSTSACALAEWWCATRPGPGTRAVLTAPSLHQVKNILWYELRRQWPKISRDLGGELPNDPSIGVTTKSGAQILGISTNKPENLAGVSGSELLFIIDEASGYPDELWEVIEGNTAGGAKVLAISNPTRPTGWFFEAFQGIGEWHCMRISSEETPNVVSGERLIPGLATRGYVERMRRKYGPAYDQHRRYRIRVLGEFPETADAQVIALGDLETAQRRWLDDDSEHPGRLVVGVDPAWYGGDPAVVQPVRGRYAYQPAVMQGAVAGDDIAAVVVLEVRRRRRLPIDDCVPVVVDGVSAGADTVGALRRSEACQRGELTVIVHEGFRAAANAQRFANRRTEVWFHLADWLKTGCVPPSSETRRELLAGRYTIDAHDRFVLEPKKTLRKRLKKSPNHADALTLATSAIAAPEIDYQADLPEDDWDDDDW